MSSPDGAARPASHRRRFSQHIRQVLARGEGALAEARPLCDSQMDDAHAMLASDPAFRAEWATFC